MKLILFALLFSISAVFLLINCFAADRNNLFPAAAIFLLIGGFLLTGPGLQIQEGIDYSYQEYNNKTVVGMEKPVYETVEDPLPGIDFSEILGLLFMVMGAGYMVMASPGRFVSLLRRR
jgi:hypothetical protein